MTSGGKYFFQILVNNGYLIKVGVTRKDLDPESVSALFFDITS